MITPAEKAAAEFAKTWKITEIQKCGFISEPLPSDVIHDIEYRLNKAFLAGASWGEERGAKSMAEYIVKHTEHPATSVEDLMQCWRNGRKK